ncbi:MAG: hypothetical protein IJO32_00560 [Bacilli bacterium]|nr:hypothetical protein [Bacilli bacterium]
MPIRNKLPYGEYIDEIINDMCYTLKNNKKIIEDLSKGFTKAINISFSVIPDEMLTMDIYCSKLVETENLELEKSINLEHEKH